MVHVKLRTNFGSRPDALSFSLEWQIPTLGAAVAQLSEATGLRRSASTVTVKCAKETKIFMTQCTETILKTRGLVLMLRLLFPTSPYLQS